MTFLREEALFLLVPLPQFYSTRASQSGIEQKLYEKADFFIHKNSKLGNTPQKGQYVK